MERVIGPTTVACHYADGLYAFTFTERNNEQRFVLQVEQDKIFMLKDGGAKRRLVGVIFEDHLDWQSNTITGFFQEHKLRASSVWPAWEFVILSVKEFEGRRIDHKSITMLS